ncbi:MAG: hypothetical protein ACYCTW_11140 [Sulfuricella sp.]
MEQIRLADRILARLKVARLLKFMVLPVSASVLLTETVVTMISLILKGEIASDYLFTGLVIACIVSINELPLTPTLFPRKGRWG